MADAHKLRGQPVLANGIALSKSIILPSTTT
jgi:hypothetical protein